MVTEIGVSEVTEVVSQTDGFLRVLMFYGATCGPCKMTMPHYEKLTEFFDSKHANILFFKMNAWEPQENFTYCNDVWNLNGVPNFKAFYNGEVINEKIGGGDEQMLKEFVIDSIYVIFNKFGVKI